MWHESLVHGGCRHRLICIVNVHDDIFRVIGDIVYVRDNVSDNIRADFLSFCVVML